MARDDAQGRHVALQVSSDALGDMRVIDAMKPKAPDAEPLTHIARATRTRAHESGSVE